MIVTRARQSASLSEAIEHIEFVERENADLKELVEDLKTEIRILQAANQHLSTAWMDAAMKPVRAAPIRQEGKI